MAQVRYNGTLEYATNTLVFTRTDEIGRPLDFNSNITFSISRIDNENVIEEWNGSVEGNVATIIVTPSNSLYKDGDKVYDYDNPTYEHVYSLKDGLNVYMCGKLNLIKVP